MKKIYTFILLLTSFTGNNLYSQSDQCEWARKGVGASDDYGSSVTTDMAGNVYITGFYSSPTITFGTETLTNSVSNNSSVDIYIVKYDPSGTVLWAKTAGGAGDDISKSIKCDATGNVYVTGYFACTQINFGTTDLNKVGLSDVFLVKLDPSGGEIWARSAGGNFYNESKDLVVDASGSAFIVGDFSSNTITFGPSNVLTNNGGGDVYVAKYDLDGNIQWAVNSIETGSSYGNGIALDTDNNIYVTGNFNSATFSFGSQILTNTDTFSGTSEIFLVKLDGTGTEIWAQQAAGAYGDESVSVITDENNNVYITGNFMSITLQVGLTTLSNASSAGASSDFYIAKFDNMGTAVWAKRAGASNWDFGIEMVFGDDNNIYLAGTFDSGTINFGLGNLSLVGSTDVFVVKYDVNGTCTSSLSFGENSFEDAKGIALDGDGNVFLTGQFYSTPLSFGTNNITLTNTSPTAGEVYLAKFKSDYTGLSELESESLLTVYPNPGNGLFSINTENDAQIIVTNELGQVVLKKALNSGENVIDISKEEGGIYFISLLNESGIQRCKLSKN